LAYVLKIKIMGACQFKTRSSGKTPQEAYNRACEIAEDEYGHQDGYNGTISTTAGFRDETEAYKLHLVQSNGFLNMRWKVIMITIIMLLPHA